MANWTRLPPSTKAKLANVEEIKYLSSLGIILTWHPTRIPHRSKLEADELKTMERNFRSLLEEHRRSLKFS
jgi:hypothetical protein